MSLPHLAGEAIAALVDGELARGAHQRALDHLARCPECRAAVNAAAHGPELDAEGRRDLLVAESLDVAQHHGDAELGRQRVQRHLDLRVEVGVVVDLLRAGLGTPQPLRVLRQRLEPDPLPAPHHVEEQVRGDPVQPALEGARPVLGQRAEDPDERLLGQVLGVLGVARQAVGQPVHPRGVLSHDLLPRRRDPGGRDRGLGLGFRGRVGHRRYRGRGLRRCSLEAHSCLNGRAPTACSRPQRTTR